MRPPRGGEALAIAADRGLLFGAGFRFALQRVEVFNRIES
jgi:hypothetical protein